MKSPFLTICRTHIESYLKSPLLWIAGSGLLSLYLLMKFIPIKEEAAEWEVYFYFPVSLLVLLIALSKFNSFPISAIKALLILLFLYVELDLYYYRMVFLLAAASFPVICLIHKKTDNGFNKFSEWSIIMPAFVIYVISFLLCIKLCYWGSFDIYLYREHSQIVMGVVFLLGILAFTKINLTASSWILSFLKFKFLLPLVVFIIFSFNLISMGWSELHHWGCYIGPAELVRQGGYLLWDVPSQYGFLSILSIVVFPLESCWQSFYILQVAFLTLSASMLFLIIYSAHKNIFNYIFAATIAIVSVFMVPGYLPDLVGATSYPSVGPYRFLWVQVLLFFLAVQYKRKLFNENMEVLIGSLIWLVSAFWSFEVAYYASLPWFGYLLIKSIRFKPTNKVDYKKSILQCAKSFLIPISFFGISLIILVVFYHLRIHRLPDWLSYYEHALSFKKGFQTYLVNSKGGIGLILLVMFFMLAFIYEYWIDLKKNQHSIAIMVACFFAVYTSITYFIGRSHENNILNVIPVIVLAVAVAYLVSKYSAISYTYSLFRYFTFPFYFTLVVLSIGNKPDLVHNYLSHLKNGYLDMHKKTPPMDNTLEALMMSAGVTQEDSVAYMDDVMLMNLQTSEQYRPYKHWLPLNPMTTMNPLDSLRTLVYMKRFSDHFKTGGYLIKNKNFNNSIENFISQDYYPVGKPVENAQWKIQRYVRKGNKFKGGKKVIFQEENIIKINFDSTNLPGLDKAISSDKFLSGKHSYVFSENGVWSPGMVFVLSKTNCEQISQSNFIKIKTSILPSDTNCYVNLILDLGNKQGQNVYWAQYPFNRGGSVDQWHAQEFLFLKPKQVETGGTLKIYFTKSDSTTRLYVDNIFINGVRAVKK